MVFEFLFETPQNRRIQFSILFCFKIDHVLFIRNAPIFMFEKFELPHFQNQLGKVAHIKYFEHIENLAFRIKHVASFEIVKGPKIQFFDFGAIQLKCIT